MRWIWLMWNWRRVVTQQALAWLSVLGTAWGFQMEWLTYNSEKGELQYILPVGIFFMNIVIQICEHGLCVCISPTSFGSYHTQSVVWHHVPVAQEATSMDGQDATSITIKLAWSGRYISSTPRVLVGRTVRNLNVDGQILTQLPRAQRKWDLGTVETCWMTILVTGTGKNNCPGFVTISLGL